MICRRRSCLSHQQTLANLSVRRALLSARKERVRRRAGGSRPGRRLNRSRDIDPGAYAFCEITSVRKGSRRSTAMARLRTAFRKDDGLSYGILWGAPAPLPDDHLNDGRGCDCAPIVTERYMRMA